MPYSESFTIQLLKFYQNSMDEIRNFPSTKNDPTISHYNIVSYASYSPWKDDEIFLFYYNLVKEFTLVDIYRCYELYNYIVRNNHLKGDVLEVGVWRGGTGCLLAVALSKVDVNAKIYLADTFSGVVKAGYQDTNYKGGEHADTTLDTVLNLITKVKVNNTSILKGIYPEEVSLVNNTELRLCHIDVDTYQSALDVFNAVWPQIVSGGAVIFDDYGFWGCEGVTKLCNSIKVLDGIFIHNLNGHALFIKK